MLSAFRDSVANCATLLPVTLLCARLCNDCTVFVAGAKEESQRDLLRELFLWQHLLIRLSSLDQAVQ